MGLSISELHQVINLGLRIRDSVFAHRLYMMVSIKVIRTELQMTSSKQKNKTRNLQRAR